jgi:hypothetical protein
MKWFSTALKRENSFTKLFNVNQPLETGMGSRLFNNWNLEVAIVPFDFREFANCNSLQCFEEVTKISSDGHIVKMGREHTLYIRSWRMPWRQFSSKRFRNGWYSFLQQRDKKKQSTLVKTWNRFDEEQIRTNHLHLGHVFRSSVKSLPSVQI